MAYRMAKLSRDAYLSREGFATRYTNFDFFSHGSTQCYLLRTDTELIVVFRGTEPTKLNDILADIKFRREYEPGWGMVHRGFRDALNLVYPKLLARIVELRSHHQVIFTGHSLGAAVATLCCSRFSDPSAHLYTFGSPRVGDRGFSECWRFQMTNCWRLRNHNDVVTRNPGVLLGYRHVGDMFYISHAGTVIKNPPWWVRSREFATGMIRGFGRREIDSFADHSISHYVEKLRLYARGES
jgi:pimeloyl-ACP methyl ester carboxylesterase